MKRLVINKPSRNSLTNLSLEVATKVCRRLYEYEDTGLTPEEIQELKADRDYWEHEAKKWCAKLGEQKLLTEKQNISEIRDLLLPKCDKCEYLEVETRVGTVYGEYEIVQRTIDIDCKHSDMCSGLERKLKGGVGHGRCFTKSNP